MNSFFFQNTWLFSHLHSMILLFISCNRNLAQVMQWEHREMNIKTLNPPPSFQKTFLQILYLLFQEWGCQYYKGGVSCPVLKHTIPNNYECTMFWKETSCVHVVIIHLLDVIIFY